MWVVTNRSFSPEKIVYPEQSFSHIHFTILEKFLLINYGKEYAPCGHKLTSHFSDKERHWYIMDQVYGQLVTCISTRCPYARLIDILQYFRDLMRQHQADGAFPSARTRVRTLSKRQRT